MRFAFVIAAGLAALMPVGLSGQVAPVQAPAPSLSALASLQPGLWMLRSHSHLTQSQSLCISDTRALLQIRHRAASCSRFVIAGDAHMATVHYTCPGAGHGRTTIRVENPRLVQIETQGIADREPFEASWEGRRTGECPAKTGNSTH